MYILFVPHSLTLLDMKNFICLLLLLSLISCNQREEDNQGQASHQNLNENFTINRLIIINDNNEMLMMREQHVQVPPSYLYSQRQFVKEGLDSLANAFGMQISSPELRGQFSFKYDYQPYATLRNYYVAKHLSGEVIVPEGADEAKWLPVEEAIETTSVTAIKQITERIISAPNVVWGGSFLVSHVGEDHPTKIVEDFYPLFTLSEN